MQGLAWGELKQLWQGGILAYITVPWNLADLFTLANFMGWIGSTWKFLWDGQMCKSEKLYISFLWDKKGTNVPVSAACSV